MITHDWPDPHSFEDGTPKRVAIYIRTAAPDPHQSTSFELQHTRYMNMIQRHSGWHLVDIYSGAGISGRSLKDHAEFSRMMEDCEAGKIDLIIVRSVSRFWRNVVDSIQCVRQLATLPIPVGVYFEAENIYSLDPASNMLLSIAAQTQQRP